MAVMTAIKQYVPEDVLRKWLTTAFGAENVVWSMEQIAGGKPGIWQVTAPAAILQGQQIELTNESHPTRQRTFGR